MYILLEKNIRYKKTEIQTSARFNTKPPRDFRVFFVLLTKRKIMKIRETAKSIPVWIFGLVVTVLTKGELDFLTKSNM